MEQQEPVLELRDLHTYFPLEEGLLKAVNGVSLTIHKNRTLGVVGESGCGKSVTAQSILRIVPEFAQMTGEILLHQNGHITDLAALAPSGKEIRDIRGRDISMIFQEPMTAFSPVHTVGDQIMEAILVHEDTAREEARSRAVELLSLVGIPMPDERVDAYPHQLSGGMRQRAMIAMALALKPKLLIADEPTTALDVTIQAQILRLMKTLQAEMGMSIMFITHDLGVIANMADEVAVMYLGRVVEFGSVRQIFRSPQHPYTQALLRSIPRTGHRARVRLDTIEGIVPVPLDPPDICPFSDRCTQFIPGRCDEKVPDFLETESGHSVRCILYE
ncbi:MAG: ABC transporter ATP-binding protein [Caldilineaceae bacterium SB0670_bin_27]|uniref:ABC transporter ATP-binding protein n=1 Tax=Caldilineaceae bacterium SB0664_bin_27 TaxID=2605260 RepID=A0A6B0YWF2_9CHLR|nr:ABC transporter ATP-binding protein [Caldilineaceae bacterium SB0664_bin_27]MYJ77154.1 ABC transporter ATP-binding protein [Caldilineaceae bacterium SB0670_bin_27]